MKQVQVLPRKLYLSMKKENFSPVIADVIKDGHAKNEEEAHELLDAFLQWFSIIPKTNPDQPLQMLSSVDKIWHSMILHTSFYRTFCEKYIGEYVDHNPLDVTGNSEETKKQYATYTVSTLKASFGEINVNPWLLKLNEDLTCCMGCSGRRTFTIT